MNGSKPEPTSGLAQTGFLSITMPEPTPNGLLSKTTEQHMAGASTDTDSSNDPLLGNNCIGPLWRPRVAPYLQIYGRSLVKTLHYRGNSRHLLHVPNHP
ncbi:hypothetical protein NQZ68_008475 [Dissostichus eleginoides]|nr:hypothetical protein NQZ68_008475 [Dissostichus eleginoides]